MATYRFPSAGSLDAVCETAIFERGWLCRPELVALWRDAGYDPFHAPGNSREFITDPPGAGWESWVYVRGCDIELDLGRAGVLLRAIDRIPEVEKTSAMKRTAQMIWADALAHGVEWELDAICVTDYSQLGWE